VDDFTQSDWRQQVPDGQWYQQGDWWVIRERTTKPFGLIKIDANKALLRGLNGLFSTFEWRGQILHVRSIGCEGDVRLEGGYLIGRVRFDFWASFMYPEILKDKIKSEVGAGIADTAGASGFGSKNVFIVHGHNEAAQSSCAIS
jgi:hypothetical protein